VEGEDEAQVNEFAQRLAGELEKELGSVKAPEEGA